MDEARNLLRDAKRRRQFTPQGLRGVLKKTSGYTPCGGSGDSGDNQCSDENRSSSVVRRQPKRLRFAEELNEIHEIPALENTPLSRRGGFPISMLGAPALGQEMDWVYEATKAVSQRPPLIDEAIEIVPPDLFLDELEQHPSSNADQNIQPLIPGSPSTRTPPHQQGADPGQSVDVSTPGPRCVPSRTMPRGVLRFATKTSSASLPDESMNPPEKGSEAPQLASDLNYRSPDGSLSIDDAARGSSGMTARQLQGKDAVARDDESNESVDNDDAEDLVGSSTLGAAARDSLLPAAPGVSYNQYLVSRRHVIPQRVIRATSQHLSPIGKLRALASALVPIEEPMTRSPSKNQNSTADNVSSERTLEALLWEDSVEW